MRYVKFTFEPRNNNVRLIKLIGGDLVRGFGGEVGALAPKKIFCRPLRNVKFGGGAAGDSLYSWITIFNLWILCIYSGFRGF